MCFSSFLFTFPKQMKECATAVMQFNPEDRKMSGSHKSSQKTLGATTTSAISTTTTTTAAQRMYSLSKKQDTIAALFFPSLR
jgi:hypothetical protein